MPSRTWLGTSSIKFFSFLFGKITVLIPARLAPRTFSLMPPTGSTRPDNVTSPVMDRSDLTGR